MADRVLLFSLLALWAFSLGPGCELEDPPEPALMVRGPCPGGQMRLTLPAIGRTRIGLEPLDCVLLARIEDGAGATTFCPSTHLTSKPARLAGVLDEAGCARVVR